MARVRLRLESEVLVSCTNVEEIFCSEYSFRNFCTKEDIIQEAWCKFLTRNYHIKKKEEFYALFKQIVRNTIIDAYRRSRVRRVLIPLSVKHDYVVEKPSEIELLEALLDSDVFLQQLYKELRYGG